MSNQDLVFTYINIPWQRTDKRMSKLIEIKVRVTKIKKNKKKNATRKLCTFRKIEEPF